MRKHLATIILATGLWAAQGRAQILDPSAVETPLSSKEGVRKAIAAFQGDPLHQAGTGTRLAIMQFAQNSPAVRVVIGPKPAPWMEDKEISSEVRTNLLTAYIAGNVKSQLEHGEAKNDFVAGCEQVIATYGQMQKAEPGLKIPEVENLVALQKQGKLAEYLADAETATGPVK